MSKFKVTITRTETYTNVVEVEAENEEQAKDIVWQKDSTEGFEYDCPDDVKTDIKAEEKEDPNRTYTLPELAEEVHIDSWVEGISAMCNMDEIRKEVYEMAGMEEDEDDPICPAEFETEYTELAEKYNFRFNRKGQIVSFDLSAGKKA